MKKILLMLALSASMLIASDATGKWSGSFAMTVDGETHDDTAFLDLKQEGSKITGVAGPNTERARPIKMGNIAGNKIKLEVPGPNDATFHFDLTMDGDQMTGDAKSDSEEHKVSGKLNLKREKL